MNGAAGAGLALLGAALLNVGAFASPILALAGAACLTPVSIRAFKGLVSETGASSAETEGSTR